MKIKGIKKVCSESKNLDGNAYMQICFDGKKQEIFAIWHTGYYVNFQTYFADKAIHTIFNTQKPVSQKYIRYKMYRELGFFRSEFTDKKGVCYWDDCDFNK